MAVNDTDAFQRACDRYVLLSSMQGTIHEWLTSRASPAAHVMVSRMNDFRPIRRCIPTFVERLQRKAHLPQRCLHVLPTVDGLGHTYPSRNAMREPRLFLVLQRHDAALEQQRPR